MSWSPFVNSNPQGHIQCLEAKVNSSTASLQWLQSLTRSSVWPRTSCWSRHICSVYCPRVRVESIVLPPFFWLRRSKFTSKTFTVSPPDVHLAEAVQAARYLTSDGSTSWLMEPMTSFYSGKLKFPRSVGSELAVSHKQAEINFSVHLKHSVKILMFGLGKHNVT